MSSIFTTPNPKAYANINANKVQCNGFQLVTNPSAGDVLVSDSSGNGSWGTQFTTSNQSVFLATNTNLVTGTPLSICSITGVVPGTYLVCGNCAVLPNETGDEIEFEIANTGGAVGFGGPSGSMIYQKALGGTGTQSFTPTIQSMSFTCLAVVTATTTLRLLFLCTNGTGATVIAETTPSGINCTGLTVVRLG